MPDSLQPYGLYPIRHLCPWDSPGKNTGEGCPALHAGIELSSLMSPAFEVGSLPLVPPGKPRVFSGKVKDELLVFMVTSFLRCTLQSHHLECHNSGRHITELDTLWWWLNQAWFPTSPVWAEISDSDWEGWVTMPYLFDTKDGITFSPWFLKYPMFCFILFVVSLQTFGLISEYQDFLLNF